MERVYKIGMVFIILIIISCNSGNYNFVTKAIYKAPKSDLKLNLIATGFVPSGSDIAEDGNVIGTITSKQLSDTIYFSANSILITDLEYNKKTIFLYDTSIVSSKINTFYYEILNIL